MNTKQAAFSIYLSLIKERVDMEGSVDTWAVFGGDTCPVLMYEITNIGAAALWTMPCVHT